MERLQIKNDIEGMQEALIEAKKAFAIGEIPIGAIICDDKGNIIARGHNLREKTFDATAHAEIVAIRKACTKLQNWRLSDLTLYVTIEPCPMCAGAIVQARIPNVVFGTRNVKAGCAGSILNILDEPRFNHQVNVIEGILREECAKPMGEFFKRFRKKASAENSEAQNQ